MSAEQSKPKGIDLAQGVPLADIADGSMVGGHVGDEAVLLARNGGEFFAIGSTRLIFTCVLLSRCWILNAKLARCD